MSADLPKSQNLNERGKQNIIVEVELTQAGLNELIEKFGPAIMAAIPSAQAREIGIVPNAILTTNSNDEKSMQEV